MNTRLFVGNLPFAVTDKELAELFSAAGSVVEAKVMMDKFTGRSRGFGFVTMPESESAAAAIATLNRYELDGRTLVVNEARPKEGGGARGSGGRRY